MTETQRAAIRRVLKACEQRLPLAGQAAIIDELNNLRAALAEPVQEPKPITLPSEDKARQAFWDCYPDSGNADMRDVWMTCYRWCRAIVAVPQQQAEPEPEPVAWMDRFGSVVVGKRPYETFTTPLYTTPPARRACWCATCDKAEHVLPTRMSLCPNCGDKRCPRADFHGNECREKGGNDE